jgi:serine/threonine-protein kinase
MELLEGRSLTDLVAEGPMSIDRALHITRQIADALDATHAHGVVHRDLKPDNVFLVTKDGDSDFVKVLDFGISKVRAASAEQVRVTHTGQLVGTPLYISPELARGDLDPDHRADVYSLGVMLYEMLTGTPPFVGTNAFQLLWKHGNEAPLPIDARRRDISAPIARAVMRALEKDPASATRVFIATD